MQCLLCKKVGLNISHSSPKITHPWKEKKPERQQCTFSFVGLPSERVVLEFEEFDLQGTPPECFHEYLDLFTEIQKPKDKSLIETPFGGRYCGKIPPRLRISLYNGLSFVFHSDRPNITEARFSGTFRFMPEGKSILLLPQCLKITQNVAYEFLILAFATNF